ncbi:MAG: NAD-dependent dihydropyrimidine dehydrogenase subunit PreA [Planctomycetes bacterium]|nr:NAD-dependent dihydropyrimidine dehydrogenase subunit PreA [Planctomycetota bacterium]
MKSANIKVGFCGLEFDNPFILASGPPTRNAEMILRGLEQGWAGAVTKTVSLNPTRSPKPRLAVINNTKSLVNIELISSDSPDQWIKWIKQIKRTSPDKIIIASIMAANKPKDWQRLARMMADSGADALELNVSCPHGMPEKGMGSLIGQDPKLAGLATKAVKKAVAIPVMVKLTPNVTDIKVIARACADNGADALSGINTVKSLPGVNINTLAPLPNVKGKSTFGGYAGRGIKPIALRCIAEMSEATGLPISAGGGIFDWEDAVEFMLLGAQTLQLCTAVMLSGYSIIHQLKHGLNNYLLSHKIKDIKDLVGLSNKRLVKLSALKHQNPIAQINQKKCILNLSGHCHRCFTVCKDGGFQAISYNGKRCSVIRNLCGGCGLCIDICPNQAIKLNATPQP